MGQHPMGRSSVQRPTSVYSAARMSLRVEKSCPILMNVGPKARRLSRIQTAVFRCLLLFLQAEFPSL